jgi:hypothetical protein
MTLAGLLIGGVIPAVCLGLGTALMRASVGARASIPVYLALVGSTVAVLGWGVTLLRGTAPSAPPAIAYAVAMGAPFV